MTILLTAAIVGLVAFVLGVVVHEWATTRQPKTTPQPIDFTRARRR